MTAAIYQQLWRFGTSGVVFQMIRYGIAGGLATVVYSSVYLPLAWWVFPGAHAVLAVPFAFTAGLAAGFLLHSRWTFAGHGSRDTSGRQHARFLAAHCCGLAANLVFTWTLTAGLGAPPWVPLLPGITITPLGVFVLQRQWVFA